MSWYRPHNVWEGIAGVLIGILGTYTAVDTIKAHNQARYEEWRAAYREAQSAADIDGNGRLDPEEVENLRRRLDFQGEFGSGTLISGPQPPREALEMIVKAYAPERRSSEEKIGQAAGISSK